MKLNKDYQRTLPNNPFFTQPLWQLKIFELNQIFFKKPGKSVRIAALF